MHGYAGSRVTEGGAWPSRAYEDRVQALLAVDPTNVQVVRVDSRCWRVVDGSAEPGDPGMLLGFVERHGEGVDCTLMAALQEHRSVTSSQAAHEYFVHVCGPRASGSSC